VLLFHHRNDVNDFYVFLSRLAGKVAILHWHVSLELAAGSAGLHSTLDVCVRIRFATYGP
jgi:hypothetical protein